MQIDNSGLPIHSDATLAVEPRLILEGNFYVNLDPGAPGTPELPSGGLIPESNTSVPVQIDQVLDTLNLATRGALQGSIRGLARGLGGGSSAARSARVPTGYAGLRAAVRALNGTLPSVTQVAHDAQGTRPGDLHRAVRFSRDLTTQLAENPVALAGLVANVDTVTGALSAEDQSLATSLQRLDGVLRTAPASLTALDAALPTLTGFSRVLDPALRLAPAPFRETDQFVNEVQDLVAAPELPAVLAELKPVSITLPKLEQRLQGVLPLVTSADKCLSGHVVSALDQKLQDGSNSTGDPAWLDLMHTFTSITSLDGGFDGNGSAIRAGITVGASTIAGILPGVGAVAGIAPSLLGVRPTWLGYGVEPPYRPDQWCDQQPLPDLNARSGPAPSWDTAGALAHAKAGG